MSYNKTWHRDYAAESLKRAELSRWATDANMQFALCVAECGQGAALAQEVGREAGSDKIVAVAQSVLYTINGGNRYRKITAAQKHTLAVAMLEKYGTGRGIAAAIWGLTDAEIDGADA
jgi:hypothetical protein